MMNSGKWQYLVLILVTGIAAFLVYIFGVQTLLDAVGRWDRAIGTVTIGTIIQFDGGVPSLFGYLFAFGSMCLVWGFQNLSNRQQLERFPTSKIRGLALGLVDISGKINTDQLIESPLSKTKCAYYRITVGREPNKKQSGSASIVLKEEKSAPFYLEDETGKVLVNLEKAEIKAPEMKSKWVTSDSTGQVMNYLNSRGVKFASQALESTGMNFGGLGKFMDTRILVTEHRLDPGMQLYIQGTVVEIPEVISEQGTANLEIAFQEGQPFFVSTQSEKYHLNETGTWAKNIIYGLTLMVVSLLAILWYAGYVRFLIFAGLVLAVLVVKKLATKKTEER